MQCIPTSSHLMFPSCQPQAFWSIGCTVARVRMCSLVIITCAQLQWALDVELLQGHHVAIDDRLSQHKHKDHPRACHMHGIASHVPHCIARGPCVRSFPPAKFGKSQRKRTAWMSVGVFCRYWKSLYSQLFKVCHPTAVDMAHQKVGRCSQGHQVLPG